MSLDGRFRNAGQRGNLGLRLASRELQKLDNAENPKPETTGLPPDYVRAVTAALGSWPDKPLSPEELDRKLGDDLKLAADRHGMTVKQILQTLLATFASLDSESEIESEEMYELKTILETLLASFWRETQIPA
jgi:hypothetical protein